MGRKRRSAWGTITRTAPGVWRIRYWANDAKGRYRRMSSTVRGTRMDAEKRRSELMLRYSEDAPCPTVAEAWERWYLPSMERRVEDGDVAGHTLTLMRSAYAAHVEPKWGEVSCDAVKPLAVQQWLDQIPLNSAMRAMEVMRPLMDFAVRYGYAPTNPMRERYIMPSRSTVKNRDAGVWSLDELGEVWRSVRGEWIEAAFILAGFGGLRVGESLGVKAEDVSDVNGCAIVEVRRQVPNRGKEPTDRLKTPQSRRSVAIPGLAGRRLLELAAEGGWLSGDGLGGPNTQTRLNRAWSKAVPEGLRHPFRNLRNSWQTNMRWSLRVPVWAIEAMMGHSVGGVTGKHYDRPSAEMFAEIVAESYASNRFDEGWFE